MASPRIHDYSFTSSPQQRFRGSRSHYSVAAAGRGGADDTDRSRVAGSAAGFCALPRRGFPGVALTAHVWRVRGSTITRSRRALSNAFVVLEVTTALLLLAGAGLMIRTVLVLQAVRPGFVPYHVVAFQVSLSRRTYGESEDPRLLVHVEPSATLSWFSKSLQRCCCWPG